MDSQTEPDTCLDDHVTDRQELRGGSGGQRPVVGSFWVCEGRGSFLEVGNRFQVASVAKGRSVASFVSSLGSVRMASCQDRDSVQVQVVTLIAVRLSGSSIRFVAGGSARYLQMVGICRVRQIVRSGSSGHKVSLQRAFS